MIDDLRSDDGLGGFDGHFHDRARRRTEEERPLADREVPLGHQEQDARVLAPAVHAWLDGELPEASVRKGDTGSRRRILEEDQRRGRTPPPHAHAGVPRGAHHGCAAADGPRLITPWFRREFVVTPKFALTTAAAIVVVAAAVTITVMVIAR